MVFIDNGLEVRSINGSSKHFIREDGIKITKRKDGSLAYFKGSKHRSGYMMIGTGNGQELTHRVVAKAFHPNPNNLPIVDHKDNNSTNNHKDNLRWVTSKENINYYHTTQKSTKHTADVDQLNSELLKQINSLTAELQHTKDTLASTLPYKELCREMLLGNPLDLELVKSLGIGNTLIVDGKIFGGTGSAAAYICHREKSIGNTRNKETINKELKRFQKGERPQWLMYEKYTIGY